MYSYQIDYVIQNNTPVTESITVAEAKQYCRVTNNVEDDLFVDLIIQARQIVEKITNTKLVPCQVDVWFNNSGGNFQLPFGPVTYILGMWDQQNNQIPSTTYRLMGAQYPIVRYPLYGEIKMSYMAGYDCVPTDLKVAMLDQINYDYENRGMDVNDMGICEKTMRACQRWTRTSPIL